MLQQLAAVICISLSETMIMLKLLLCFVLSYFVKLFTECFLEHRPYIRRDIDVSHSSCGCVCVSGRETLHFHISKRANSRVCVARAGSIHVCDIVYIGVCY